MCLDIVITKSPFTKPIDQENFDLNRYISIDEWHELFQNVLGVPEIERHISEDRVVFLVRRETLFKENMTSKGYEMLGRIWYILRDAYYLPSEIDKLLKECLEIKQKTQNELALSALENLIFACGKALKVRSGIWLVSD
jgi:hypothetical protein